VGIVGDKFTMNIDYKTGDVLVLVDTRVVRLEKCGAIEDVLIVSNADGSRDIIRRSQVRSHQSTRQTTAYARK
jgi:hypothetical protein